MAPSDDTAPAEETPPPIRWGRVFLALLCLGLVVEATMQAFVYRWSGGRYRSLAPYLWSPYGLVRNNPELTSTSFQINANGFRNLGTFAQKKPPRTLRVMVLGGSVIYSGLGQKVIEGIDRVDSSSTVAQYLEQDLRADPALAGLGVEVINAAVNFNRIKEVSAAYIADWAYWDADFVIYGASGNNFAYAPPKGTVYARRWNIQTAHPWEAEFQRIANERSPAALAERGVSTLESFFATVGVVRKGLLVATDAFFAAPRQRAFALGIQATPAATIFNQAVYEPAPFEEFDTYVDEYLGYAGAMAAVAKRHRQPLAFFWEYLLSAVAGIKPMGPVETSLYEQNRRPTAATDALYDAHARDAVHRFCDDNDIRFLDPIERLRTHEGLVYIDYIHYTREGNRFMARFMYDSLRDAIHERAARLRTQER